MQVITAANYTTINSISKGDIVLFKCGLKYKVYESYLRIISGGYDNDAIFTKLNITDRLVFCKRIYGDADDSRIDQYMPQHKRGYYGAQLRLIKALFDIELKVNKKDFKMLCKQAIHAFI